MARLPFGTVVPLLLLTACADFATVQAPPPLAPPEPGAVAALDRMSRGTCNPAVASSLAGVRIPISDVRGLTYGLYRSHRRGHIVGYDAWVKLADQPGAVVVSLDEVCRPMQIYARGGASLAPPP